MQRSPLILTGLALIAAAAAMVALHSTPPPPLQVRLRSETARPESPNRSGLDPAVASTSAPRAVATTAGRSQSGALAADAEVSSDGPASLQRIVSARIVQCGKPVAGRAFVLVPKTGPQRWQNLRTDENGRFCRSLPSEGEWELRATGDGLSAHQRNWTVTIQNDTPLELGDLELRPLVRLDGVVESALGAPLGNVRIVANLGATTFGECTTNANGKFELLDVPTGELRVEAHGRDLRARALVVVDAQKSTVPLQLKLRPRAVVRFTLRDDDGRAVAGAVVENADPACTSVEPSAVADEVGVVEVESCVGARLCVRKDGWLAETAPVDSGEVERRIVLRRIRDIRGSLGELGDSARIHVGTVEGATAQHPFVRATLEREVTAAADGSFHLHGLVAGRYTIRATAKNGSTVLREFSLPQDTLLNLQLVPGTVRTIDVRDDRGEPVPFATAMVARGALPAGDATSAARTVLQAQGDGPIWRADHRGRIECALGDEAQGLAVMMHEHLPVLVPIERFGAEPFPIEIPRATVLDGRLTDVDPELGHDLRVVAWPNGSSAREAMELPLDPSFAFRSGDLKPGRYNVCLLRRDRSQRGPTGGMEALDLPLLGGGLDTRTTMVVDARGGESTKLLMPVPTIGRIDGVVREGGRPVKGATVFAVPEGTSMPSALAFSPLGFDDSKAARAFPRTTTDADGRFTMLVARPGRFAVRARTDGQPFSSLPVAIDITGYSDHVRSTIELPTAVVRGRFAIDKANAASVRAYLVPLADAEHDPFANASGGIADVDARLALPVAQNGEFTFRCVEQGSYVLRFVDSNSRIVRQRLVRVAKGPVDLETMVAATAAPSIRVAVQQQKAKNVTAHVLQLMPDLPGGSFAATFRVESALVLQGLAPGRYRVVFFDGSQPIGSHEMIEVFGNGTVVPKALAIAAAK
ncbi:MAG: hypothetical protein ABL997_03675 [Planctomycetota bacterium]